MIGLRVWPWGLISSLFPKEAMVPNALQDPRILSPFCRKIPSGSFRGGEM